MLLGHLAPFSTKGNPPALPGDPKSLTVPEVIESLPTENRSKFSEKEASIEQRTKFKSFSLGLQVPHRVDTEMPTKSTLWQDTATSR